MIDQIPDVVILRLPLYTRALAALEESGVGTVSSQEMGNHLRVTPAQIRKDLSYFGKFGKQGRGYNVKHLLAQLRCILGLDKEWKMILVGVGHLGRAIASYKGFASQGFHITAALDTDPEIVGNRIGEMTVKDIAELGEKHEGLNTQLAILAVPAAKAQEVTNVLTKSGIKAILNYAHTALRVPPGVWVRAIDPVSSLQSMTDYLNAARKGSMERRRAVGKEDTL